MSGGIMSLGNVRVVDRRGPRGAGRVIVMVMMDIPLSYLSNQKS
jgi:hypothetical protein